MEALRKAEEAKRQAAQKEHGDTSATTQATGPALEDDPIALEAHLDVQASTLPVQDVDVLLDFAAPAASVPESPSLDVPFDFQIDESFTTAGVPFAPALEPVVPEHGLQGSLESTPAQAAEADSALSLGHTLDMTRSELTEPASSPEIDYLEVENLRQFTPASLAVFAAQTPSAGLSLEIVTPEPQAPRAAFIDDAAVSSEPEPTALPSRQAEAETAVPPRTSRVDEVVALAAEQEDKPERQRIKVVGSKASEENRKRESARAVFNAKAGQESKGRNTRRLLVIAGVLVLVPLAGGVYLFMQELGLLGGGMQYNIPAANLQQGREFPMPVEQEGVVAPEVQLADVVQDPVAVVAPAAVTQVSDPVLDAAPDPGAAPDPVSSSIAVTAPAVVPAAPAPELVAAEVVVEAVVSELPIQESVTAAPVAEVQEVPDAEILAQVPTELPAAEAPAQEIAAPAPPINITRSTAATQINPQLTQAYAAFRDQDFYAARALYQQALRELPNNRDVLLGLAATAMELGDVTSARATYSRLLELDPRDALARVGLLDSMPLGDPVQTESQLQSLRNEHPEVAQLSFALGNFYAAQRRWNEAQAAYYDALLAAKAESGSGVSPDFAFNLAVSLERLNQPQPAFNFYREALDQARNVNPGFDLRVLRERLDALQRVLP